MTFKLKALAAAVMVAAAAPAFAAIADGSTGNGELLLTVWDQTGLTSYTRDLGIEMNNFGTANRSSGGFTNNVDTGGAPLSFAADANWNTFISGVSPANRSTLVWDVTAIDSAALTGPATAQDQLRFLSTSTTRLDWSVPTNAMTNSAIANMVGTNGYIQGVNQTMTAGISVHESKIYSSADNGYAGGIFKGVDWGTKANFVSMNTIDSSSSFNYITRGGGSAGARGIAVEYGNALGPASWTLASDGTLTFAAPVPEPGTYAMMALGLVALGVAARKTRSRES